MAKEQGWHIERIQGSTETLENMPNSQGGQCVLLKTDKVKGWIDLNLLYKFGGLLRCGYSLGG